MEFCCGWQAQYPVSGLQPPFPSTFLLSRIFLAVEFIDIKAARTFTGDLYIP